MQTVLLIEDEYNVASFIKKGLQEEGYKVLEATSGELGLEILDENQVDLIILDIMLPGKDGRKICEEIRRKGYSDLPVLMLTALGTTDNIVKGLDSGADDYISKPFKFTELLARIRALLRRKQTGGNTETSASEISFSDLTLNLNTRRAMRAGKEIKLTATEYRLLHYFMRNTNKVLSRIDLLENVWDIGFDMKTNVVDVYVNYLRNKVDKGHDAKLIQTAIGMGYIMKDEA